MIVVTGSKRSGTSMWMQILMGAGFPVIGEPFPGRWRKSIAAANPSGFFESPFRRGVLDPDADHPVTGRPLAHRDHAQHAIKIFVPGLVRTHARLLGHVIGSMRNHREYEVSRRRMWQLEDEALVTVDPSYEPPARPEPIYEWWTANYVLLVDALRRGYPLRLWAYDTLLENPGHAIEMTLGWLGGGDLQGALAAVQPQHRTQRVGTASTLVEQAIAVVFDELYDTVRQQKPLLRSLVGKLEAVNRMLVPRIKEDLARVQALRATQRARTPDDAKGMTHDDVESETQPSLVGR